MKNKRMILSIFWLLLGIVLFALSATGKADTYWSGTGGGLIAVGILQLVRFHRMEKDPEYRESLQINAHDERNQFIRHKAWAWAGCLFIVICGIAVFILKLMGQELLSVAASYAVCLMLILYWVSWMVLKKKY